MIINDDKKMYERSEESNAYKKYFFVQGNLHKDYVQEWIESEQILKFIAISESVYDLYDNAYNEFHEDKLIPVYEDKDQSSIDKILIHIALKDYLSKIYFNKDKSMDFVWLLSTRKNNFKICMFRYLF